VAFLLITEVDIKFIKRNHCGISFLKPPIRKFAYGIRAIKKQLIPKAIRFATNEQVKKSILLQKAIDSSASLRGLNNHLKDHLLKASRWLLATYLDHLSHTRCLFRPPMPNAAARIAG
jgi:hypothetical protein